MLFSHPCVRVTVERRPRGRRVFSHFCADLEGMSHTHTRTHTGTLRAFPAAGTRMRSEQTLGPHQGASLQASQSVSITKVT